MGYSGYPFNPMLVEHNTNKNQATSPMEQTISNKPEFYRKNFVHFNRKTVVSVFSIKCSLQPNQSHNTNMC